MRDEGLCGICGQPVGPETVTIDHVIPLARGGSDQFSNLQLAHGACNQSKHAAVPSSLVLAADFIPHEPASSDPLVQDETVTVTVAETAAMLGLSVRAIQDRIKKGEMQAEKITPRLYLVHRDEVARWKPIGKRKGGRPRKRQAEKGRPS